MENASKKVILTELANRVRELRKEKGVSQQDAYNDTGLHFARIEQGNRNINYTTLYKICDYFKISPKEFFNDKYDK